MRKKQAIIAIICMLIMLPNVGICCEYVRLSYSDSFFNSSSVIRWVLIKILALGLISSVFGIA